MRLRHRLGRPALLGLVAIVAALAAAVSAIAGSGAASDPIKLFVIAPVATPIQNYPDAQAGAEAAAAAINKKGGIKGRKIEIAYCNTRSNANTAVACARQAVSEKSAAVVGHISTLSTLEMPILQQARIPDVGMQTSGNAIDWTNPFVVPARRGLDRRVPHDPVRDEEARQEALRHRLPGRPERGDERQAGQERGEDVAGLPVVGSFVLPGATTDFAPYVQKLREAKPDSVMFINSPGVSGGLIRAATAFGVKPLWSHNSGSIGEPEAAQIGAPVRGHAARRHLPDASGTRTSRASSGSSPR